MLVIPSAVFAAGAADWRHDPVGFLTALAMFEVILCACIGGICMAAGYVGALRRGDRTEPRPLIGFGAALSLFWCYWLFFQA
ncbi:MAG: hypothetical protein IT450_13670 [Phycisphaerales bacterium]|nr:hypothetical protein [Phycisphaerales bacterium]